MLADNQEVTSKKMKQTTDHGQILMAIDNLYKLITEEEDKKEGLEQKTMTMDNKKGGVGVDKKPKRSQLITSVKEYMPDLVPENFDNMQTRGGIAASQLMVINQALESFKTLSISLKKHDNIQEQIKHKKEQNEIV